MKCKALIHNLLLAALVVPAGCDMPLRHEPPAKVYPNPGTDAAAAIRSLPKPGPAPQAAEDKTSAKLRPAPPPAPPAPPSPGIQTPALMRSQLFMQSPMPYLLGPATNTENYAHRDTNPVQLVAEQPVSTFSIDVDTGSYTNVRRMLNQGELPPADAVRTEEFINYFDYGYALPANREQPFSVTTELAPAPWNKQRDLLLIGIQGYRVPKAQIPASNLVFLIDTSGSMAEPDKLPLLQASLKQLVRELRKRDRVAIVTYAGSAGVALPSTAGDQHATIDAAIDALGAAGSTNGGAGIDAAYAQAEQGFIKGGVNRVILATDGHFNVGNVGQDALKTTIEDHRKSGVALTTLGFGQGNTNDAMAVMLADAGNGSHHYIDSLQEGRRVLVDEMSATLLTIAKDVKIQVEFNPAQVSEYRLIGYEKRMLKREDFNNDRVDAGDIGAGANVTAIYEITRKGSSAARIDALRYGNKAGEKGHGSELAFLRLRYKLPGHDRSRLIEQSIAATPEAHASQRLDFAAAVGAFAGALRGGKYLDSFDYSQIARLANHARGTDPDGYRAGFVQLVKLADGLSTRSPSPSSVMVHAAR